MTAVYHHGESEPSSDEEVSVVFVPDDLRHTISQNSVTLTWDRPRDIDDFSQDGLIGYHIYRDNEPLTEIPIASEDYTDTLTSSGTYVYSVRAVYTIGLSETISIEVEITVSDIDEVTPINKTFLKGNYPNPFNPETTIQFDLVKDSEISIEIYNIKGQKVRTLFSGQMNRGSHTKIWNGTDDHGQNVSSGIYFYRLIADDVTSTRRMVLMK